MQRPPLLVAIRKGTIRAIIREVGVSVEEFIASGPPAIPVLVESDKGNHVPHYTREEEGLWQL
jgi:hypothetical protein